ncbi:tRNA pseudouridine(38-40) synthase TruA [Ferrovum sp. PN-J185]|uniref:tRNA pseudouridine(38-40) synthase TruA n=1 Tax=Ferrovum sp. PN-J185 TaxID=1356306 RepID=UPI000791A304|nr:tRNA pseudouridine(38-40) synthase TruA [Ferrovum sp. PN-J185]KXW55776.1 tRNA pseudouridine synthase A [Ferrovum sp. PN-J185]MCC6068526.1 tRNA pseudouridine(38-40) synthase TruA [Ferrovum sp. PN-J185]MDE1892161.1 tRNA pseudouridine(38-40) synthase TruA [Betaproteobacteria bacterium]
MRIALGVEYDGSRFCGWQKQPHLRSVQATLNKALSTIAGEEINTVCAGRTDAEVHALGQVIHFDTNAIRPHQAWVRGVNSLLPRDVCVLWAKEVDELFHARFSALSRTYHYWLYSHPIRPALAYPYLGWTHMPLNLNAIEQAMHSLLGEQDFSAFRSSECQAKSPIKIMYEAQIIPRGALIQLVFRANAFLHHMVRNMVGALVYIGQGRENVQWVKYLLEQKNRTLAAPTFAPHGLYLSKIEYSESWQIPDSHGRPHFFI